MSGLNKQVSTDQEESGREMTKRLRNVNWDDYGISKHRYQELKAFCLQYGEKKSKIRYDLQKGIQYSNMPKGTGIGNPVEEQVIKNEMYKRDCSMIEEAAVRANPGLWKYIVKSVTLGIPYEYVEYDEELGRITVGKTEFNAYRRLFYHYLDVLKNGFKLSKVS